MKSAASLKDDVEEEDDEEEAEQMLDSQEGRGLNVYFLQINYSQDEEKKTHH